jgi:hypothetical protein
MVLVLGLPAGRRSRFRRSAGALRRRRPGPLMPAGAAIVNSPAAAPTRPTAAKPLSGGGLVPRPPPFDKRSGSGPAFPDLRKLTSKALLYRCAASHAAMLRGGWLPGTTEGSLDQEMLCSGPMWWARQGLNL